MGASANPFMAPFNSRRRCLLLSLCDLFPRGLATSQDCFFRLIVKDEYEILIAIDYLISVFNKSKDLYAVAPVLHCHG